MGNTSCYGRAEGSLNQHIKLKHPDLAKERHLDTKSLSNEEESWDN